MIVDPDSRERAQLAELLKQQYAPAAIKCFADPLMAIQYGAGSEVNALYVPVVMKRFSGFELGRVLRRLHPQIALHFIGDNAQERTDAMCLMVESFLLRPLTEEGIQQSEEPW